jgi:hypothetical protein
MWGLFYLTDRDRIHARIVVRATVRFIFVLGDHVITSERSELAPNPIRASETRPQPWP